MSFNVLIWFSVGVAVYLTGLGVFVLIKRIRNKRKVKKEDKEFNINEEDKKIN